MRFISIHIGGSSFPEVAKVWKQEHEAAGQVAATVGKQTEANAGAQPASPFYSVGDPSTWE